MGWFGFKCGSGRGDNNGMVWDLNVVLVGGGGGH